MTIFNNLVVCGYLRLNSYFFSPSFTVFVQHAFKFVFRPTDTNGEKSEECDDDECRKLKENDDKGANFNRVNLNRSTFFVC